eukprot:7040311-Prymnesium_polylepis.6
MSFLKLLAARLGGGGGRLTHNQLWWLRTLGYGKAGETSCSVRGPTAQQLSVRGPTAQQLNSPLSTALY